MTHQEHLTLSQTIFKVDTLINSGNGDSGRLYHILEFLKNNKPLYHSDKIYLENKLKSPFSVEEEESIEESELLPKIKGLIDSGNGDPGRLQFIYDTLAKNRPLYRSDAVYLELKLTPSNKDNFVETIPQKLTSNTISPKPKKDVPKSNISQKIKGIMPKGWSTEYDDLENITKNLEEEQQKVKVQQKNSDEINKQRLNLSQLISHRKESEQKIIQEKSSLESQIKEEQIKIETQTKISNEIISQKEELGKVKKESDLIIQKIALEKNKISKDLLSQKKTTRSGSVRRRENRKTSYS